MSCGGTLGVTLEWRSLCGGTSGVASSVSRTLSRLKREGGFLSRHHNRKWLHLALRRKSPGFSQVASGNLGFFLSTTRTTGYHLCGLWKVQSPCELRGTSRVPLQSLLGPRSSSGAETTTSGFLFSAGMDFRASMQFPQGCQASPHWRHAIPLTSRAVTVVSGLLSS